MKPPPENSLLIFCGSADISDRNMRRQLANWLPKTLKLDAPVIQAEIPASYPGLQKVSSWLDEEFRDSYESVPDLAQYIGTLQDYEDVFLIVLWGKGGDEPTEQLVDMAMRRDIKVLDLNDGLDTLELGARAPATATPAEPAAPARPIGRPRTRPQPGPQDDTATGKEDDDQVPWKTGDETPPAAAPTAAELAAVLARAFQAAADVLREFAAPSAAAVLAPVLFQAKPARSTPEPAEIEGEPVRTWWHNPDDPADYQIKTGRRGRVPNGFKSWPEVELTAAQEKELGLSYPQRR